MYFVKHYLLTTLTVILLASFPFMGGTEILSTTPAVEALSIVLLMTLFLLQQKYDFINRTTWIVVLLILLTPLLYLIPLPTELWNQLPGRQVYSQVLEWILTQQPELDVSRTLSLIPYRTEHAFFALLPPIAIFLTVSALPEQQKLFIIYFILGLATAEASLAVIQFSTNNDFFYFGIPRLKQGIALGTYPNPDHFVLLMEIALPLVLSLFAHELQHGKKRKDDGSISMMLYILYSLLTILFVSAAFFSGSRAGIPLALLSLILAYIVFMHNSASKQSVLYILFVTIGIIILLSFLNLTPVINRFLVNNPFIDGRWLMFSVSGEGIASFFPVGSGPGTFPDIYRIFQPVTQTGFINHAHNDYLELIFETGLIGIFFILTFIYLSIRTWYRVKRIRVRKIHYLRIGAGISLLIMLLHSLVEFNLHDATNVLIFAVLSAIFFYASHHTRMYMNQA